MAHPNQIDGHTPAPAAAPAISRIFMAFEPSYWRGMLCTMGSLLRHVGAPVTVEVLTRPEHTLALQKVLDQTRRLNTGEVDVRIIPMSAGALAECDSYSYCDHLKAETLFRLYYFDASKAVGASAYIDIDVVYRAPLAQFSMAVPADLPMAATPHDKASTSVLELNPGHGAYFNAGVLLFNSEQFIDEIVERMEAARRLMPAVTRLEQSCHDQDALNIAFEGRWAVMPHQFNYVSIDKKPIDYGQAHILHATGSRKPWMLASGHRYAQAYDEEMAALGIPWIRRYDSSWIPDRIQKRFRRLAGL